MRDATKLDIDNMIRDTLASIVRSMIQCDINPVEYSNINREDLFCLGINTRGKFRIRFYIAFEKNVFFEFAKEMKGSEVTSYEEGFLYVMEILNVVIGTIITQLNNTYSTKTAISTPFSDENYDNMEYVNKSSVKGIVEYNTFCGRFIVGMGYNQSEVED